MESQDAQSELRRVDPRELTLGRVLPGNLRDADGAVLVQAGEELTPDKLQLLAIGDRKPLFVGPDWPPSESPAEEDGPERATSGVKTREVRQFKRHNWKVNLHLELVEPGRGQTRVRTMDVTSNDISLGGFSFLAPTFVHVGTVVFTQLNTLKGKPVVKAVVRNCVHFQGRMHRVGVEFVKPDANDLRRMRQIH